MMRKNPSQIFNSLLNQIWQVDFGTGRTISSLERRELLRRLMLGWTACSLLPSHLFDTILTDTGRASEPVPLHAGMGMPGPFPGTVVEVKSPDAILQNRVNAAVIQKMIEKGMTELTGAPTSLKAWQIFFNRDDIVGIKINASGVPGCVSSPEPA